MLDKGLGKINGVNITKQMYNKAAPWCDACAKGKCKQNRHKPRENASEGWPKRPNMLHAFDAMGEMIRSLWGHKYCTVVKDHHDGRTWTYAHRRKDKKSLAALLTHHDVPGRRPDGPARQGGHDCRLRLRGRGGQRRDGPGGNGFGWR